MEIKKFILAIFIVISLNFSYQPVSIYAKEKELIVYIIESKIDNFTNDFVKINERKRFHILVSLTLQVINSKEEEILFNTS